MRARAIEMLMCDFRLDQGALESRFGAAARDLDQIHAEVAARFAGLVALDGDGLTIRPDGKPLARIIASHYDAHLRSGMRFSRAS